MASCPIEETKEFIEFAEEVGESEAYKIHEQLGKIPTGEERQAHINRINTQAQKESNLNQADVFEEIINGLENGNVEKLPNQEGYINTETGEKYSKRVSMLVDDYYRSQNIYHSPSESSILKAKKGTVIHEYMRFIMESHRDGKDPDYKEVFNKVKELNKLDEFENEQDNFFNLRGKQFEALSQAGKDLYNEIQDLQKSIDPDGEAKIFLEIPVGDQYRNVAGTIDMLAVFSDGSASMYDWKTFSKRGKETPGTVTTGAWDVQLSNYRHILKDNYGINKFRHVRAIPIKTRYSAKDTSTGQWVNDISDGFQHLAVQTKENNLEYLKPIPFGEETGDENLDSLLRTLREEIKDLDKKISVEKHNNKKFKMMRSRKRLLRALNDLELTQDVEELFNYLRNLVGVSKRRLAKSQSEEGYIEHDELVNMWQELEIFSNINVNFKNLIENEYEGDQKEKLRQQVISAADEIRKLMDDVNAEMLDRLPADILKPGQLPGNVFSKYIYGVGNWDIGVMKEFTKLWRSANGMVRRSTQRDIGVIKKADKAFSEWAKKNGYGANEKFKLLHNDKKHLHRKHTDEFYEKFSKLKKKARKKGLDADDKKWLNEHYEFDEKQLDQDFQRMKEELSHDVEIGAKPQSEYERLVRKYLQGTHVKSKPNNKFKSHNFKYWSVKKNLTNDINPNWQFIQDNKPVKQYYDMYIQFNRRFQDLLGPGMINENFVANVESSVTENILENGTRNVMEAFRKSFEVRQHDELRGRTAGGESIQSIPILFLTPLRHRLSDKKKDIIKDEVARVHPRGTSEFKAEVEKRVKDKEYEVGLDAKSIDLTKSLMLFSQSVHNFVQMSKIEPMVKVLKHLVDTDQVKSNPISEENKAVIDKFTGFVAEKFGLDSDIKDIFNSFVNRMVYKKKFDRELMETEKYSSNKIILALMNWLSVRALGMNIVIGAANYIQGATSMRMIAREGRYFDTDNLKESVKAFAKREDQYADIAEYFLPSARDIIREKIELSGASSGTRRLTQRSIFLMHVKGDDAIDHNVTAAMSKNYVVDDDYKIKNPKTQELINENAPTVYESIKRDDDGELTLPGVTLEESEKFRAKIQKQTYLIKGTMSEEQKGAYASSIIWTAFMQFRTWMGGLGEARLGQLKYDPTMEEFEVGRYNIALGTLFSQTIGEGLKEGTKLLTEAASMGLWKREGNRNYRLAKTKYDRFLANNPKYKGDLTFEQFKKLYESKVNGLLSELRAYLGILMLVQILRGLDWDDEDDANIFSFNAHQIVQRAFLEVSFWLNPRSVDEIVQSPLPLMGLFREITKIIDASVREVSFAVEGERPARVKTSPGYYILKSTPVVNQVLDFNRFFHQYNPPQTMTDHMFEMVFGKDEEED